MTCPAPPEAAPQVFGSALDTACRYVHLLADRGVAWGLIGPREVPRLWERHILNCAVLAELVDDGTRLLVDIGSGAGLPGVVLAMLLPDVRIVLLEPMLRRARFLTQCASDLGVRNVTVCRRRAEEVAGTVRADVVTARAVAPLNRLAPLALPLLRPGGVALAVKGRGAHDELASAAGVLRVHGARCPRVVTVGHGIVEPPTTVIRFVAGPDVGDRRTRRRGDAR